MAIGDVSLGKGGVRGCIQRFPGTVASIELLQYPVGGHRGQRVAG